MSGHTPSPWNITKVIPIHSDGNDYEGVEISWREVEADGRTHPHDAAAQVYSLHAQEDALLIAAAPEMYEALQRIAQEMEAGLDEYANRRGNLIGIAKFAIAKAEGRQ